ncbi:hypothetical protein EN828_10530 [Mesorhizobium sp. M2D.F.Ca.ET.185.01.1.1]|uniref:hypothetical protein n=1 Tax=unclassified Mesorhizobium TaxID=325217 RepID=UPI000FCC32E6|nr:MULTISPECIES: hypothetical protein [unclassified Mesorhizobium]TGV81411.1 hypothetical protein EN792_034735 [Mesorhizobium sp. M00.F.Ca.ET.149.01.1.1]TGP25569.1 hypothetical protein EN875_034740 [Mesorhizobium sp. M2D.F.Ca.ET.232.01.1.1]TGQ25560.1 hypothetical protein EN863_057160 [Mesorhizobium sp. M00.F.Ca.ET.220.01.1.1]TGQ89472.1 hypothetical protein EN849_10030 [Mesorhizobium sp. M2D.F.Ca.ET.206.01.1.1]TGS32637.1 hypothetical protein EN828_10530 [Mesorhizobium sp. M2D.F.Ca.ET.185.01.1.1
MGDPSSEEVASAAMTAAFEDIDKLARELFNRACSTEVWSAADHATQLWFRKEAARKLQERYRSVADRS